MRSEEEKIIEIRLEQSSCVLRVKQASQLMKNRRFGKARAPEKRQAALGRQRWLELHVRRGELAAEQSSRREQTMLVDASSSPHPL